MNTGSATADLVGLYHYSTRTNQVREGYSSVDIDFHYAAVDTSGNPINRDHDGIPDRLADSSGDGIYEPRQGSCDWQTHNSPNGLTGGSGLQVFTPLK